VDTEGDGTGERIFGKLNPFVSKNKPSISLRSQLISTLNALFEHSAVFIYENLSYYETKELIDYTISNRKAKNIKNPFNNYLDSNLDTSILKDTKEEIAFTIRQVVNEWLDN